MASSTHPHYVPPASRQGGLGIWYRAIIVVVAIVMAGLPWCRSDQSGYVATGDAVITSDSANPEAHAHLQPLTDEILKSTTDESDFANYLAQHPELKQELGAKSDEAAVELFRRRLEVTPNRVGGQITLHLSFYGSNRDLCEDVLSRFLSDFQTKFQQWKQEKQASIQTGYNDKVQTTQAELNRLESELAKLQPSEPAEPRRLPTADVEPKVNQQWTVVSIELETARQQLRTLQISRTDRHPQVVDKKEKVDKLTQLLATTPKHIDSASKPAPSQDDGPNAITAARKLKIAELEKQRDNAQAQLTALANVKQHADQALGFIQGIHMDIAGDHVKIAAVGGVWKVNALLVLGGWTIFMGLIAFMLAAAATRPEAIRSPGKLAAATSVPVAATLTLPGSAAQGGSPGQSLAGPVSFLLTRAAELTVIGILGLVLLAVQTNPVAGQLLHDDPLGLLRMSMQTVLPSST